MHIKTHGSESRGQEEAACTWVFWPTRPLQWVVYTDGSSKILKCITQPLKQFHLLNYRSMVGSKKKLTFCNCDYLVIRKKVCRKCVPQFVLFSTFALHSMFICTTPSIFTFVLCIVLRLAMHKTTIRSYWLHKTTVVASYPHKMIAAWNA